MQLKSIKYSEFEGQDNAWLLEELYLGPSNLIVGKNSSGKTRCLNLIAGLAQMLSGRVQLVSDGKYYAQFENGADSISYELALKKGIVHFEEFKVNNQSLLIRNPDGKGEIRYEAMTPPNNMAFQTSTTQLAALLKQDQIQHPFLTPLYEWASNLRNYSFSTNLGQNALVFLVKDMPQVNDYDQNRTLGAFRAGVKEFGDNFRHQIISDMHSVDYLIDDVGTMSPSNIQMLSPPPGEPTVLFVKEKNIKAPIEQFSLSTGMFRVLAILIHINLCKLKNDAECILIDDVGEGLDFERSCKLVKNIREKTANSKLQLVMTTNDRFVMNTVPLSEWTVLQRQGNLVKVRNHQNSHEAFEKFKFTGLSNFSFFEMGLFESTENS